jgi:mRNA interferase MazF
MPSSPQEILASFVSWTKLKFQIHTATTQPPYFREREIWWASIGVNIGHEQDGKNTYFERPVLVLRKFNQYMFWGVPQSSKAKQGQFYYQTADSGESYSLMLSQMRVFSSKRLIRKLRTIPGVEFEEIKNKIKALL